LNKNAAGSHHHIFSNFLYQKSLKQKKKDWRKNKLLTERLSDLNTSDEERRWKTKKEREQKDNDK
jgi:hypothetical protein